LNHNFTVTANSVTVVNLNNLNAANYNAYRPGNTGNGGAEGFFNTGIQITSDQDVSVVAVHLSSNRTEAASVLPIDALGQTSSEYYVASTGSDFSGVEGRSEMVVVGIEDGTEIEITPTANTFTRTAGTPFTITLNQGQTYQLLANTLAGDLTGTFVRSVGNCKRFALFAGHGAASVSCAGARQHLYEQMAPVVTMGRQYLLLPYTNNLGQPNNAGYWQAGYPYRIIATQDNTVVNINGQSYTRTVNLSRGQAHIIESTSQIENAGLDIQAGICVTANNPILVYQMSKTTGATCNGANTGDGSLLMMTPVDQPTTDAVFNTISMATGQEAEGHFINVVMKRSEINELRINGSPISDFLVGPPPNAPITRNVTFCGDTLAYAIIRLGDFSNGNPANNVYRLTSADGRSKFVAYLYGFKGTDAYAYSVGATFENLSYRVLANVPQCFNAGGNVVNFRSTGPGILNYTWDFGDGSPIQSGPNLSSISHPYNSAGIYEAKLTITVAGNCANQTILKPVEILEIPNPAASLGATSFTICREGGSVTLNAGAVTVGQANYEWVNLANPAVILADTRTYTITQAGNYRVTVRNRDQCPVPVNFEVVNENIPLAFTNLPARVCANNPPVALAATPAGGTFFVNNVQVVSSPPRLTWTTPGDYWVKYRYTSPRGCIFVDSQKVEVLPLPQPRITNLQAEYCRSIRPFSLTLSPPGGTLRIDDTVLTAPSFIPNDYAAGPHKISYWFRDANNCEDSLVTTFDIRPTPPITFDNLNDAYCSNQPRFTLRATPSGGVFDIAGQPITQIDPATFPTGEITVRYTYTESPDCVYEITKKVQMTRVNLVVDKLDPSYCINAAPVLLNATPPGGQFIINNQVVTELDPGRYPLGKLFVTYRYTEPVSGCVFTARDSTVINTTQIDILNVPSFVCKNDRPLLLQGAPAGGQFILNGGVITILNPANLDAGNYELLYTDPANCTVPDTARFEVRALHEVNLMAFRQGGYCSEDPSFALTGSPAGGRFRVNGRPNGFFNPRSLGPGRHSVVYEQTNPATGCTNRDSVIVEVTAPPPVNLGPDIVKCENDGPTTLNAFDPAHGRNFRYLWNTGATTPFIQAPNRFGTSQYYVTVTNPAVCRSVTDTINITYNASPIVELGPDIDVCDTGAVTLDARDVSHLRGFTYRWNTGATTPTITVNHRGTRLFWVEVTDRNEPSNCATRDTIRVSINERPVVNLGRDTSICDPRALPYTIVGKDLSHNNEMVYRWVEILRPNVVLSDQPNLPVSESGAYILTVRNRETNCAKSDTIEVLLNANPVIDLTGYTPGCQLRDTLVIRNTNVRRMKIDWLGPSLVSIAQDRLSAIIDKTGRYTVTVTDTSRRSNCTSSESVEVLLADFPELNLPTQITVCQDSLLELNAALPSHPSTFRYEWRDLRTGQIVATTARWRFNQATMPAPRTLDPVRFEVRAFPPSGCLTRDTVEVQFLEKAVAKIADYPRTVCAGQPLVLQAEGQALYNWRFVAAPGNPATAASGQALSGRQVTLRLTQTGLYRIVLEATNTNAGCTAARDTATFVVNPGIAVNLAPKNLFVCADAEARISAALPSHAPNTRYTWVRLNRDNSSVPVTTGAVLGVRFANQPSFDTVRYVVTVVNPDNNCPVRDTVRIAFERKAQVAIRRDQVRLAVCLGDTVRLTASGVGRYRWNTGDSTAAITVRTTRLGENVFIVNGSSANSCAPTSDTIRIRVDAIPVAVANPQRQLIICAGESTTLRASGGVRYTWRHGPTTAETTVRPSRDSTWYYVRVFNSIGCASEDSVLVRLTPRIDLPAVVNVCQGTIPRIGQVSPELPARYLWNNGDTVPIITVNRSGRYIVRVQVRTCTYSDTVVVNIRDSLRLRLAADTIVCFAKPNERPDQVRRAAHRLGVIFLNPIPGETYFYEWFGPDNRVLDHDQLAQARFGFDVSQPGVYRLRLRDAFGCVVERRVQVREICEPRVKLPEGFTPNGDNLNDFFAPLTSDVEKLRLQVFNRWGMAVYDQTFDRANGWTGVFDEKEGWDGNFNGSPAASDTYQYVITWWGRDLADFPVRRTVQGVIHLIREHDR
jgi:gliding motility-associated-like protein